MEMTDLATVAAASGGASWLAVKVELRYHWEAIKKLQADIKELWVVVRERDHPKEP